MGRIAGVRLIVHGRPPEPPYFLVGNHLCWLDLFGGAPILDGVAVMEEPLRRVPVLGRIFRALDPIFVRRVKEDTQRVMELMTEALLAGKNVIMAPEIPATTIPRGTGVRQFRAGLFESAIRAQRPVHYVCVTYRTPPGCPPPSQVFVFGPNPLLRTADGKIPESELKAYGGKGKPFLRHVLDVFSLPYCEFVMTFSEEPVVAPDRVTLANTLHDRVDALFAPWP